MGTYLAWAEGSEEVGVLKPRKWEPRDGETGGVGGRGPWGPRGVCVSAGAGRLGAVWGSFGKGAKWCDGRFERPGAVVGWELRRGPGRAHGPGS